MSEQSSAVSSRLRRYRADLHVHTALSPCGSEEMTPPAIVETSLKAGLDMIAICDHNTAGNVLAGQQAAKSAGGNLTVLPGIEITSVEEVHVLGLFPEVRAAEGVAERLRTLLPTAGSDYYAFFGEQPLLDADGQVLGAETAALAAATTLDLTQTVELIHFFGGLAVAAHVDRPSFGVFSQLGFFPKGSGFDAVEVSRYLTSESSRLDQVIALGLPVTASSDSHFLEEIGTTGTDLRLAEPTFAELALAFAGTEDRSVVHA